jgi:hypothetical protein
MKILLIGNPVISENEIHNFSSVWSFYLSRELKKFGIQIEYDKIFRLDLHKEEEIISHYESLDVTGYDHIIALGLRYFDSIPRKCGEILKRKITGKVTQLYDGGLFDSPPVDLTFTFRDDSWKYPENSPANRHERHHKYNKYIGWAADESLCRPTQDPNELRILVDHSGFNPQQCDMSLHVMMNIQALVRSGVWKKKFDKVTVRRLIDGGVEDCDIENIIIKPYHRNGIPYTHACNEYSKAHIFMVTHRETVGLTILETAMAGALPLVPKGYAPQDRLDTIRHIAYETAVNWSEVMDNIDVELSRKTALLNSWESVTKKLLSELNFDTSKNS